ncbi:hypothetical protein ACQCN2_06070 [Brevibacillus ginsengisoli]
MQKSTVQTKSQPVRVPNENKLDRAELPEVWLKFYDQVLQIRLAQIKK